MSLLLLFLLSANNDKVVEVHFTEVAPVIDGVIEEVWETADSATNFVQFSPYEKESPAEKTVVYVLQDKENLYFAFRCYAEKNKPIACLTGNEDDIKIGIDPFGSKTTAYYFIVYASKIIDDGWLLDDGRRTDNSWDGVWYRAVKLYDDRYEVEVKIPFKSIRYKKGLSEWGINFVRYIAANRETDYWIEASQLEENMVSKFGALKGISPYATGYYFELYPEGFLRYDKYGEEEGKLKPRLSLNFKWDLTPEMTLNATTYPDFAQIESDPYSLNLSRYPTYLDERRPFFLEGKEIFRMSDFGQGKGFFRPLDIFYSRRIGKSIDGEVIPILTGLKLTNKSEKWNAGVLGAYTDKYSENGTEIEPHRGFGVFRAKHRVFENSDIGMLISGTMVDRDDYNYAIGLDGVYRKGINQFILQGAVSDKNKKKGWAVSSCYFGFVRSLLTMVSAEVVQDSFDVGDIGFVPWAGRKKFMLYSGPFKTYPKGSFRNLFIAPGIMIIQEPGSTNWSKIGAFMINPNFRNNWGFNLEMYVGPYYEADTNFLYRGINLSVWGNIAGNHLNFGGNYDYTYNYYREFLAYQASNWFSFKYSIIPQLSVSLSSNMWIEWDTLNTLIAITPRITPRFDFKINADMTLSVFNEFAMQLPEANFSETELLSNRIGLLFAWNFKPKSWLYIALNDYRVQDEDGTLQLENQIGAIKAKYLLYF
ncbi:carbohydrate binding family 9 domain-containing protein [candidate division WOR-3 bacterium]|nr:carbohydrate binding family 9 domain-containing protein [candidate division WOR-3 bacterium]